MKVIHIILCFLIFSTGLPQNINFLSVDDGLPQSLVSGIVEDDEGFIWISTRNGLARYDGHEFKIFQNQPYDSLSLSSNFIYSIRKGNNNKLYIRYETEEIDIFNTQTEEVTRFLTLSDLQKHDIDTDRRNWLIASNNTFWYVDDGNILYRQFVTKNGLEQKKKFLFPNDNILDVYENKDGEIWVLSQRFISKYNKSTKEFKKTALPNANDTKQAALHQRANGELMWSDNEKIHFFTPKTSSFKSWDLPEKSRHSIKWIKIGSDGKEYFESNKNIYSYDDVNGLQKKARIPISNDREIRTFLIDQSGLIWIGANTEGLYTIDLTTNFTSFYYKEDFIVDIFKQEFGFADNDVFGRAIMDRTGLSPGYFLRSFNGQQKMWIALNRSVGYYDLTKDKMTRLPDLPHLQDTEDFKPIRGISITEEGSVIVVDDSSVIYMFDEKSLTWKTSTATSTLQKAKDITPSNLYVDNDRIWVATENSGLFVINVLTNNLQVINKKSGLPTNTLFEISADKNDKNILWIGSSQGLIRFDKTNFDVESFSVAQGLPDNMIYSIVPDNQGYLWLGTNKGLCRFHTTTHQQRTFTKSHGLTNIEFNRFHSIQLPDGKIAFGGISSGVVFNPNLIQEDKFQPKTVITGIKVNNKDFTDIGDNLTYNAAKTLNLPHTQNTISVEFTALQFSQPQDILYRYRLNGYDKDWVYLDNRREAVYTKIPPGEYVLEINSSNTSGVWSRYTKELGIDISPPFWSTWWARLTFILIVLFATSYFIRHSIKQRVIKEEIVLKQKEAESLKKLDEIKTNFFSNITHEIRTPLSLIIGPAEMLQKGKSTGESKRLVSIIVKNTETLLKLTNQLLDITKLEAGVLKPQMLWGDVVAVVKKMIKSFSEEAASKQITIELNMPKTAEYLFSPNTLERIISNLISNALKFSTAGQKIEVSLFCKDNGVTLEVTDYGKGISESDLPHIFKRFYKADNKGGVPGTGIGLSLVKELVDIHQGFINVESSTQSPSGTTFEVFLPFEKKQAEETHELKPLENGINEEMFALNSNKKPLVLIVEDNEELASFLSLSLKQSYTTLLAKNGNEGLSIAAKEMPDIIISDVMMDGMDGFELCETLKKDVNLNHIPTILLTAKSDVDSKLKGLSLGADDYITKPFNISELIMRIDNKLELQSYQRNFLYKKLMVLPLSPDTFVSDKENVNNEFLDTIQKIIDKRVDDDQFGVEELAKELNMSRTSLHRKIKSMTNLAAGEIIKTYRLKKAVTFLNQGYNISETAYKTGFGSPSYFTKCFKETYKITPTEYLQKQALQPNS